MISLRHINRPIVRNEMLKLFINRNTNFNYLYIPQNFDYQIQHIPGVECCFSELESFRCYFDIDQNILKGLTRICKSVKK